MDKVQNHVLSLGHWQNQHFNDSEAYEFRDPGDESVEYII